MEIAIYIVCAIIGFAIICTAVYNFYATYKRQSQLKKQAEERRLEVERYGRALAQRAAILVAIKKANQYLKKILSFIPTDNPNTTKTVIIDGEIIQINPLLIKDHESLMQSFHELKSKEDQITQVNTVEEIKEETHHVEEDNSKFKTILEKLCLLIHKDIQKLLPTEEETAKILSSFKGGLFRPAEPSQPTSLSKASSQNTIQFEFGRK